MNLGLGRSIYSPAQLEEFACYQESQWRRRAFLAESAERAFNSRSGGQWGSGLSDLATESLIDAIGYHLVPMYRVIRPTAAVALLVLFLVSILRMLLEIVIRAISNCEDPRLQMVADGSILGPSKRWTGHRLPRCSSTTWTGS